MLGISIALCSARSPTHLHCRVYIDQEMYQPENQSPPLGDGHALAAIRAKARNYRRAGTDVGEILQASQRLAHAQVCAGAPLSVTLSVMAEFGGCGWLFQTTAC